MQFLQLFSELIALTHKCFLVSLCLCFTLQMSLHIYPKQSRIPLLVHGSIISSLVVHGPGSRVSISSLHQEPSRANIRDHLEPTSGTISSQHLGSHHLIWVVHGPGKIWGLTSFTWSCPRPRCDEKIHCFPLLITMRLNKFYLVLPQTKVPPLHHSSICGDQGRRIQAKP